MISKVAAQKENESTSGRSAKRKLMFKVAAFWRVSSPDRSGQAMRTNNNQIINTVIFT